MSAELVGLVQRAMGGDSQAFEQIIKRKHREILYITSRYANQQDLEDYAQEAILQMYRRISQLEDPNCFGEWMYTIIKRICYYGHRKVKSREAIVQVSSYDVQSDTIETTMAEERKEYLPQEFVENEERRAVLMGQINALPQNYQDCLLLFYFENQSYEEIGRILKMSQKTVGNNILRAKKSLKKRLEKVVGHEFCYSVVPVTAIPVLSQVFRADAAAVATEEVCTHLLAQTSQVILGGEAAATAAAGIASKAFFATAAFKVSAGIAAAAAVAGAVYFGSGGSEAPVSAVTQSVSETASVTEPPSEILHTTQFITEAVTMTDTSEAPSSETEAPIHTLADMIGEEYALLLQRYAEAGVSEEELGEFLQAIGVRQKTKSESFGELYLLHVLEKQDKQLLIITRQRDGESTLSLRFQFGGTGEIANIIEYIMWFDLD